MFPTWWHQLREMHFVARRTCTRESRKRQFLAWLRLFHQIGAIRRTVGDLLGQVWLTVAATVAAFAFQVCWSKICVQKMFAVKTNHKSIGVAAVMMPLTVTFTLLRRLRSTALISPINFVAGLSLLSSIRLTKTRPPLVLSCQCSILASQYLAPVLSYDAIWMRQHSNVTELTDDTLHNGNQACNIRPHRQPSSEARYWALLLEVLCWRPSVCLRADASQAAIGYWKHCVMMLTTMTMSTKTMLKCSSIVWLK